MTLRDKGRSGTFSSVHSLFLSSLFHDFLHYDVLGLCWDLSTCSGLGIFVEGLAVCDFES